ncbi:MAG: hypothetical protein WDO24_22920 [Pseudomonadota bacterium]
MPSPRLRGRKRPNGGGTVIAALGAEPAVLNPDISIGVPDVFRGLHRCMTG